MFTIYWKATYGIKCIRYDSIIVLNAYGVIMKACKSIENNISGVVLICILMCLISFKKSNVLVALANLAQ